MTSTTDEPPFPTRLVAAGLLIWLLMAALTTYVIPQLGELYFEVGAELPGLTSMALELYQIAWLLPFAAVGVAMFWSERKSRGMVAMQIGAFGSIGLFLAIQAAAYIPIFKMDVVVQQ